MLMGKGTEMGGVRTDLPFIFSRPPTLRPGPLFAFPEVPSSS